MYSKISWRFFKCTNENSVNNHQRINPQFCYSTVTWRLLAKSECGLIDKRCIPEAKQRNKKHENLVRSKENVLKCYVISILLYDSKFWTITPQMTKEMWFCRQMLRIPLTEHVRNKEVLKKMLAHTEGDKWNFLDI